MDMLQRYMRLDIDKSTIYIREECLGVEFDSVKLNSVTKATYIQFFQFFNDRYRKLPIVVKNDNSFLTILKGLIHDKDPVKAEIIRINEDFMVIDMSTRVDSMMLKVSESHTVIKDVRILFENV